MAARKKERDNIYSQDDSITITITLRGAEMEWFKLDCIHTKSECEEEKITRGAIARRLIITSLHKRYVLQGRKANLSAEHTRKLVKELEKAYSKRKEKNSYEE